MSLGQGAAPALLLRDAPSRFDRLFRPRSVAIVGISTKPGPFQVGGRAVMDHLVQHGYGGRIFPITRSAETLLGHRCYPSLDDVPDPIDCAVVSIAADGVCEAVRQGIARGIEAFVVVSSGFAESGEAGARLQRELIELARAHDVLLLGPNTTGFINVADAIALSSTSRLKGALPPRGELGVLVQSGALSSAFLDLAHDAGIGISRVISSGNEAVTPLGELLSFLVEDPGTRVVAVYAEAFRDPERFVAAARRAAELGKPIVVYKTGRSEMGRQAAIGHTGALAGSDAVQDVLCRQLGVVRVDHIEDLLPTAAYLLENGVPAGKRVGILTCSGGLGGVIADALAGEGGATLPPLGDETARLVAPTMPSFVAMTNPLDVSGFPFRERGLFKRTLAAFARDPAFDMILFATTPMVPAWSEEIVEAVIEVRREAGKPIALCWMSGGFTAPSVAALRAAGIPVFRDVRQAAAALAATIRLGAGHGTRSALLRDEERRPALVLGALPEAGGALNEHDSKALVRRVGIATPREVFVPGDGEARLVAAAREVGFPVTLKGLAEGIVHKSDKGLVRVGLPDEAALRAAAQRQLQAVRSEGGRWEGFLVCETVRPAAELLVGASRDEQFGPVLTVGAGGIYTEIFRDASLRVLPVGRDEIRAMIDECKIAAILKGARGGPKLDIEALVDCLEKVGQLALALGDRFESIDVNPVAVQPEGGGAIALDAAVFLRPSGGAA